MSAETLCYVEGLLLNVLADDNNHRKAAEKDLYNFLSRSADEFFFCVIKLLRTSTNPNVRPLCAVFLRRFLPNGEPIQFDRLDSELRNLIKNELLAALTEESHRYTRSQVADTVAELGRILMGRGRDEEGGWTQLMPFILSSLQQSSPPDRILCALHILSSLTDTPDLLVPVLPTLHPLFASLFNHSNVDVKCECCFTYLKLCTDVESKKMDKWKSFQPLIISAISEAIGHQETVLAQKVLMQLYETLISEPKWIDAKMKQFAALFGEIIHDDSLPDTLRLYAMEFFPTMATCSAPSLRKHRDVMEKALECCFTIMMLMTDVNLTEWSVTREQDEAEDRFLDGGSDALSRMAVNIGPKLCPLVQPLIQNGLSHPDWKYRFCALRAMAMVAKSFEPEGIPFSLLVKAFEDPHPQCRYMALEAIGSIALDFTPFVQQTFGKDIIPPVAMLLECSKDFPRIQTHAGSALSIFMDDIDPEEMSQYVDPLMKMILNLLPNSHYIVQEQLISLLGSLSSSPSFLPYFDHIVPMVKFVVFDATHKEQRLLRSRAMEALTFIGTNIGRSKFYPIAAQLKDLFADLLKEKYETDDVTETYVILSCMRLSLSLGREVLPLIPAVIEKCIAPVEGKWPSFEKMKKMNPQHHDLEDPEEQERLERLLHTNGNGHLHDDDEDDDDQPDEREKEEDPLESFRTTVMGGNDPNAIYTKSPGEVQSSSRDLDDELNDIEDRCSVVVGLCQNLEGAFAPFLAKVLEPLLEAAQRAPYPTIRSCGITMHTQALLSAAANIREEEIKKRPGGIEAFLEQKRHKKNDDALLSINALFTEREDEPYLIHNESLCSMYRTILSSWKQCFKTEDEPELLSEMAGKCRLFFSVSYCLTRHIIDPIELEKLVEMFAGVLDSCLERILDNLKLVMDSGEDEDEETRDEVDEENDEEQKMASLLTDTLAELMKCFGEGFMPAFEKVMARRIGMWVEKKDFIAAQRVVLWIMVDVVNYCGRPSWHWIPRLYPHLLEHCGSKDSGLRQASSCFLGIIAASLPPQDFSHISDQIIGVLKSQIEHKDAYAEGNTEATDNAVVALSKIALHHGHAHSDLWDYWLNSLPLLADAQEGDFTYSLLADQVMANNPIVMGKDGANVPRIVSLLCGALDTPFLTGEEECAKVVAVLRTLFSQMPKEVVEQLLLSVTPEERKQIIETMEEISKHEK